MKDTELATPLDDKPLIVFEETVQRPLFNADRKLIERHKEVVEAPAPASLNTGMQLVGIVKSAGAPGRALIRFAGEPIGKWVPEGETVNGWHLASVKTSSVVLEGNGQTRELQLPPPGRAPAGERAGDERPAEPPQRKTRWALRAFPSKPHSRRVSFSGRRAQLVRCQRADHMLLAIGQVNRHKRFLLHPNLGQPVRQPVRPLLHLQPDQRIRAPVLPLHDQRNLVRLLLGQLRQAASGREQFCLLRHRHASSSRSHGSCRW
jgi:hypothetical protein